MDKIATALKEKENLLVKLGLSAANSSKLALDLFVDEIVEKAKEEINAKD